MAEPATPAEAVPDTTNGDLRMSSAHLEDHPGTSHGHARPQPHLAFLDQPDDVRRLPILGAGALGRSGG